MMKRLPGHKSLRYLAAFAILLSLLLTASTAFAGGTQISDRAETLFFYVTDSNGQAVLLKAIPYDTLAAMSHGSDASDPDSTYSQSYIDAMPTPTFKEGVGVTVSELLAYVLDNTTADGADQLTYSGSDRLCFVCTDGKSLDYTYDDLLGVDRYYYPDLFQYWDRATGAVAEDHLEDVLNGCVATDVYLAAQSAGGRVLAEDGGSHGSIAEYIAANDGVVTGCLSKAGVLSSSGAFTLCFGQTAADIENASPSYSDVKKWVYSVCLQESGASPITAAGTVADPECVFTLDGDTLTITLSCADSDASIYYSIVGGSTTAPLNLYTGPITVEDYDVSQPFDLGVQAVREGYVSSSKLVFDSADIADPEDAPSFIFSLGSTNAAPGAGDSFTVDVYLTADKDCALYGGQYRLTVPGTYFALSDATSFNNWECGLSYSGNDIVVTYTYLDIAGSSGLTAGTPLHVGRLFLTAGEGGSAVLTVSSALVTQANAVAYQGVTAEGLTLTVGGALAKGDVNGDGDITMTDALRIVRYLRGSVNITADQLAAADVNGDGDITMTDALRLVRYLRGSISSL